MPERYLVTIGTFDGVHRGHQKLMRWVRRQARRLKLRTRVVFFVSPPRFHFRPELKAPLLTTSRERRRIMRALGIDRVEVLRFGPRWAEMPHTRFFEEYLVRRWRSGGVLVGRDFAFGKGRGGDHAFLKGACAAREMHLGILPLVRVTGRKISSSDIRALLSKGEVKRAASLLGRPFAVWGTVVHGRGMGRRLGFPTANLRLPRELLAPPGVFEVRVTGGGLKDARAVCNVGTRPTIRTGRKRLAVEVHIPGFDGELYGKSLRVDFLRLLRRERKFGSLAALTRAVRRDINSLGGKS